MLFTNTATRRVADVRQQRNVNMTSRDCCRRRNRNRCNSHRVITSRWRWRHRKLKS